MEKPFVSTRGLFVLSILQLHGITFATIHMVFHRILDFTRAGFLSGPFYSEYVLETIFENQLFGIILVT